MRDIVIMAGAGQSTGGAELLHQLAHVLGAAGLRAHILYFPFDRAHGHHAALGMYAFDIIRIEDVPDDAVMVFSEVSSYQIARFPGREIVFWWLSVDNYFASRKTKYWVANRLAPWAFLDMAKPRQRDRIHHHLFQSEYARLFLEKVGAPRVAHLGDYINDAFFAAALGVDIDRKENILLYNPAKGLEVTRRLLAAPRNYEAIPISGLSRAEVIGLLTRAKIYIDFGNHPGQDRIPREAATLGCCVITNRRGSAANAFDIPIPDLYKINEASPTFIARAHDLIGDILERFPHHHARFAAYRDMIAHQKTDFERAAVDLFGALSRCA